MRERGGLGLNYGLRRDRERRSGVNLRSEERERERERRSGVKL